MKHELEYTAYHEAGHACASLWLGHRVKRVSIRPEGESLGRCLGRYPKWFRPDFDTSPRSFDWAAKEIIVLYAGGLAEAKVRGRRNFAGARCDLARAFDLACRFGSNKEAEKLTAWLHLRAENIIAMPFIWTAVKYIARLLLEHTELTAPALTAAFRDGTAPPLSRQ